MLEKLIDVSLNNRMLVISMIVIMAGLGIYSAVNLPIDAVPDMTNVQVQIVTEAGALSPLEVEQYVTSPVELTMSGLPNVEEIRSVSKFGLSLVTVVFHEGTDVFRGRQLIAERLIDAAERVPKGYGTPKLNPLTTALGEILQFEVRGEGYSPMDLRTILEWQIAPRLRQVAGVTEINSHGGYYQSFEVQPDPDRLASFAVSLPELFQAVSSNNGTSGGGYVVHHGEQRFIRGSALLTNESDIENVVIRGNPDGTPVLVRDVADVNIAPLTRQGAVTRDGRGEAVMGMVMMLWGSNSRTVVMAAKERLEEINKTLPKGVYTEVTYDRAELINRTLHTVEKNLLEGGTLVVIVLLVMLGSLRAGIVVALAIPLSMLFAANMMAMTGITASLMSLGAIDFGLIVDSSVIMVENCMRRISHNKEGRPHLEVIRDAAIEVRKPTMFGELIISIVYLPLLTLQGTEGKLFRPMALTVLFALAGSLVLSLTLMPVMASLALPRKMEEKEIFIIRMFHKVYHPIVHRTVLHPVLTVGAALLLFAVSIPIAMHLGGEFMPKLDEGDLLIEINRLPSATLEDSIPMGKQVESLLLAFPEVKTVFCKTGRPEIANDVMGVQQTDVWVLLKPEKDWPKEKSREELFDEMRVVLNSNVPGALFAFTQPIEMRVDELVAGVKANVAVLIYAPSGSLQGSGDSSNLAELESLARIGKQVEKSLHTIPGAVDVKAEHQANLPTVRIQVKPEALARYGIDADQVMQTVATMGGHKVGEVFRGRMRFPIMVRIPVEWRTNLYRLEQIPIFAPNGRQIPLGELADLITEETPPGVEHERTQRRTYVQCNVRGRDVESFVYDAQKAISENVKLPTGYEIEWGGDFKNLQSAKQRLLLVTPVVLVLIFLLLHTTFHSGRLASLIFLAIPMAASGGIYALALRGMPFSISAGVGFIALFGVAVLNGLVWVSAAEHLRVAGFSPKAAAEETAVNRLRPVLMTALVASLGFLPMALSHTAGAEIQRPLATVVIGGLITSTLLTALVMPAIYPWFVERPRNNDDASAMAPATVATT
ncbi:efflux RND transporter permease subunit [Schlesneria sp. T3-172]|uniref:efflux RND transporter permease subunit n=1 Tax=Schlesneria sphaerica TaxID=3373610 RepID=UPI0037CB4102